VAVVEVMPEAEDEEILARAVSEGRIVVTNDKDFGELVCRSGWEHRGVVLLRLRDEQAENKVRMMKVALAQVGERLRNHSEDEVEGLWEFSVTMKKKLNIAIAGVLGLMVGVFGAFLVEYFEGWGEQEEIEHRSRVTS